MSRYNGFPAVEIDGDTAPGYSSGQSLKSMEKLAAETLPPGFATEWTGIAYQQKAAGSTSGLVFGLAVLFVFLVLAAQFESLILPLSIILIVPMCLLAAMAGVNLRGMDNNVLTQIGLVVLIALAAKNAILIVEFARQDESQTGMSPVEAAVRAAHDRLRPILMTSFAFILGSVPLLLATGAGAELRQALGTAVFFGMLGVTAFGLLFTPTFYVVCRGSAIASPAAAPALTPALRPGRMRRPMMLRTIARRRLGAGSCRLRHRARLCCAKPSRRRRPRRSSCRRARPSSSDAQPAGDWWRLYDDPVLDGLVARRACRQYRHPRRRRSSRQGARQPARRARAPASRRSESAPARNMAALPGPDIPGEKRNDVQVDAGLDVAYEVDLFGRVSRGIEAARGDVGAAQADADAVRVAVVADTVRAYADAASAAERIGVAETYRGTARPLADADRAAATDRRCDRARYRPHRRSSRPAPGGHPAATGERAGARCSGSRR